MTTHPREPQHASTRIPPYPDNFQELNQAVSPHELARLRGGPETGLDRADANPMPGENKAEAGASKSHLGEVLLQESNTAASVRGLHANIQDRRSIERIYPREEFERDVANNADAKALVLRGVLIESAPDKEGVFSLIRTSRNVAECVPDKGNAVFLCPYADADFTALVDGGIYSAPEEKRVPAAHRGHEYHAFIDEIIATAKMTKFLRPIGVGEDRLKGFHGG